MPADSVTTQTRLAIWRGCPLVVLAYGSIALADPQPAGSGIDHQSTTEPTPGPDEGGARSLEKFRRFCQGDHHDILFLGDSITKSWSIRGRESWDEHFGDYRAGAFGIAGDRTQYLLWRLDNTDVRGMAPRVVVLLIGANNLKNRRNTAEETAVGVVAVARAVRSKFPDAKLVLLGILPCGEQPDAWVRLAAQRTNALVRDAFVGDTNVRFADASACLVDTDGVISTEVMGDYLHPTAVGYRRLSAYVARELQGLSLQ